MTGSPVRRVDKPWGHEEILVETEHYRLKILVIRAGEGTSLQRHARKHESWYLDGGSGEVTIGFSNTDHFGVTSFPVAKGQSFVIPPNTVHRIRAGPSQGLRVIEVSNAVGDDDIERVHDPYEGLRGIAP